MREIKALHNVVLMGFMGTGKSSVAKRLALRLGLAFVDSDQEIEKLMQMSISDIFAKYGEIRFRSEEDLVVRKLAARQGIVLATGGGAVVNQENLHLLKQDGVLITLLATPEVVAERTSRKGNRPLLKKDNSISAIQQLMAERMAAYNQGDFLLDTTEKSIDEVVEEIVSLLKENEYGKGQS